MEPIFCNFNVTQEFPVTLGFIKPHKFKCPYLMENIESENLVNLHKIFQENLSEKATDPTRLLKISNITGRMAPVEPPNHKVEVPPIASYIQFYTGQN